MDKLANEIKHSLKRLTASTPFTHFTIPLSNKEIVSLRHMQITQPSVYDNYGRLDHLSSELNEFIKSLNPNNSRLSQSISRLITTVVNKVIVGLGKTSAWITVRASIATDYWDIPRWHTDGYYYPPYEGEQHKVVITLKGPGSLFYPLPNELREKFYALQFDPENRETLANMLDRSKSISAPAQSGTLYMVGTKYAAVHSEPPIHEERLFMSIVPGSAADIQALYQNQRLYDKLQTP